MRRIFQSNNNIRSQVSLNAQSVAKVTPFPKRVTFFDVFTFAIISAAIFFNSLTQRSIIFNVVIALALLAKVLLGSCFYKTNTARALRIYFMFRYLYNICIIYPLIIILKYKTGTYSVNHFIAGGALLVCELVITLIYIKYLCSKRPIENIEDIPGFTVRSIQDQLTVIHCKVREAADYISKEVGPKTKQKIIDEENQLYEQLKKKHSQIPTAKNSSAKPSKIQILEHRKALQAKVNYGFNLIRSEEEIEEEIDMEEVIKSKQFIKKSKYMAFQDKLSRQVVNEVEEQFVEVVTKQQDKYQDIMEAKEDIEREREKFRRAMGANYNAKSNQIDKGSSVQKGSDDSNTNAAEGMRDTVINQAVVNAEDIQIKIVDQENNGDKANRGNRVRFEDETEDYKSERQNYKDSGRAEGAKNINDSGLGGRQTHQAYRSNPQQQSQPIIQAQQKDNAIKIVSYNPPQQQQQQNTAQQQNKQKFLTYEEKFEQQRLKAKNQQVLNQRQQQQNRQGASNMNRRGGGGNQNQGYSDDSYDSEDDSYYSDTAPNKKNNHKRWKQQQKNAKRGGGSQSSSSLSDDDDDMNKKKQQNGPKQGQKSGPAIKANGSPNKLQSKAQKHTQQMQKKTAVEEDSFGQNDDEDPVD